MARYVLIPGAGGSGWYWHLVVDELRARGQNAVAVDLPAADDSAGLAEYVEAVLDVIWRISDDADPSEAAPMGSQGPLVLVAQSMGGFTAPMVCERVPVDVLVLVNAMIPAPGETPGDWWANTGQPEAMRQQAARDGRTISEDFDVEAMFLHDVPHDVAAELLAREEPDQSDTPFEKPWPLEGWPNVATRVLLGRDDRLFPPDLQRRLAQDRLGITPDEMPGGHLVALSRPTELAERLIAYGSS